MIIKNKGNIQSPENFNPPTRHDVYVDGKFSGVCFVHDPAAWRNKNKPNVPDAKKVKTSPKPKDVGSHRKDLWAGSPA